MFDYPETITIWPQAAADAFGAITWGAPVQAPARIAFTQEKFTDINGDQQMSKAVCYSDSPLLVADATVLLAASVELTPPAEADDVRKATHTPSMGTARKAWFA